jgi:histidyl-tRNA synthetase
MTGALILGAGSGIARALARRLARSLRAAGRSVVYPLREQSVRKQFTAAATEGAREVVVLGPEEVRRGVALVREMGGGGEREVELGVLEDPDRVRRELPTGPSGTGEG